VKVVQQAHTAEPRKNGEDPEAPAGIEALTAGCLREPSSVQGHLRVCGLGRPLMVQFTRFVGARDNVALKSLVTV
jgi:hypothetical protein